MPGGKLIQPFWRVAGMNYLEALDVATNALRRVLKEPIRTQLSGATHYSVREFEYEEGREKEPSKFPVVPG